MSSASAADKFLSDERKITGAALAATKSAARIVCEDDEQGSAAEVRSLQTLSWNGRG